MGSPTCSATGIETGEFTALVPEAVITTLPRYVPLLSVFAETVSKPGVVPDVVERLRTALPVNVAVQFRTEGPPLPTFNTCDTGPPVGEFRYIT